MGEQSATPLIRYTRLLGTGAVSIQVLSLTLAMGVYGVAADVLRLAEHQAPLAFVFAAALLLPLVISYLELASRVPGKASPFHLARSSGSGARLFAVGWVLSLGGPAVCALLVQVLSHLLSAAVFHLAGSAPDPAWIVPLVAVAMFTRQTLGPSAAYRFRSWLATIGLTGFGLLLTWALVQPTMAAKAAHHPVEVRGWLTAVSLLVASLWGLLPLLETRPLLKRPDRAALGGALLGWIAACALGAGTMLVALRHRDLVVHQLGLTATGSINLSELGALSVGLVLCGLALAQLGPLGLRLWQEMEEDGVLPALLGQPETGKGEARGPYRAITSPLIFAAVVAVGALLAPPLIHAGIAGLTLLLSSLTLLVSHARTPSRDLPRHGLKVPLHPFLPTLAAGTVLLLILMTPRLVLATVAAWALIGLLYYSGRARRRMSVARDEEWALGAEEMGPGLEGFRVLVAVGEDRHDRSLLDMAAAAARFHHGHVVALRVVSEDDPSALASRLRARRWWKDLAKLLAEADLGDLDVTPMVRIAPRRQDGILETIGELRPDLVILGWAAEDEEPGSVVSSVFAGTSRTLALVRGSLRQVLDKGACVVGTAGGEHAPQALELARAMASGKSVPVKLISVSPPGHGEETAKEALARTLGESAAPDVEGIALSDGEPFTELSAAGSRSTALLVGASEDELLGRALLTGLPLEMLRSYPGPAVIVKAHEPRREFWLRRVWDAISRFLPPLTPEDRAEVFARMRLDATASTEFYALIFLSAVIATAGLILNSGAVIIGAMLVAPLMSPILAMGHGLVHGSAVMVRRATASTLKGMGVTLLMGASLSLLLPSQAPTTEMLARGKPSLLDLLVAVASGAAAAFAVSKKSISTALPGVAIAVALVPPLCVSGWAVGASRFHLAGGALLLFVTNLTAIVLVGAIMFLILGFRPSRSDRRSRVMRSIVYAVAAILVVSIPLAVTSHVSFETERHQKVVEQALERLEPDQWEMITLEVRSERKELVVELVVLEYEPPPEPFVEGLDKELTRLSGKPVRLTIKVLPAQLRRLTPEHTP